jgi:hypothetical protein
MTIEPSQPSVFLGRVTEDGTRVVLDHPASFRAHVARWKGHAVELTIRKRRNQRSAAQNGYWWAVVVPVLAEHCGYTRHEMHDALKAKFLGMEDLSRGLLRIGSTATLSTVAFADLVDRVRLWAAEELGVAIPLPDGEAH